MNLSLTETLDESRTCHEGNPPEWSVALRVDNAGQEFHGIQPVSIGVPFPIGRLRHPERLRLYDSRGRDIALQHEVLARWTDGSIKWLLLDFSIVELPASEVELRLCYIAADAPSANEALGTGSVKVERRPNEIIVRSGTVAFCVNQGTFEARVEPAGGSQSKKESVRLGFAFTDHRRRRRQPRVERLAVETIGPLRTSLLMEGVLPQCRGLRVAARLCIFPEGVARLRVTLHNPNRARHAGGRWDLGDPGSFLFHDFSLTIDSPTPFRQASFRTEAGGECLLPPDGHWEIYQDSSGGENWQSRNHVNREGRVPCRFQGYRVRTSQGEQYGLRAAPSAAFAGERLSAAVVVSEFWQQFPKLLGCDGRQLRIGLFPDSWDDLHELQGGEQKTHTVWFRFTSGSEPDLTFLDWVHEPALVAPAAAWSAEADVIEPFLPAAEDIDGRLRDLFDQALQGPNSFQRKREVIDEYGWRNYGEVYADHENAYYRGDKPVISHYNNQYDLVYGAISQWLSTGDRRWLDVAGPLARHVIDIDIYHTQQDKAAYNCGLFWHTDHYLDAGTSTHRTFTRLNQAPGGPQYGGGPGIEHAYASGLLLYYYLTGDRLALNAVVQLADWVLRMDDGGKNVLGLVDRGPTGQASSTDDSNYHGPGRGAANAVNVLLDGWLVSGDQKYLCYAEGLIRRVIHPADSIADRNLLDAERRWSYTIFLVALTRYLKLKRQCFQYDATYSYAEDALLHYARWMADNEYPFLDTPDQLQYPTETWAAHDLRKAQVLRLAACHTQGGERTEMQVRAATLSERAWDDFQEFPTQDATRPLAIMCSVGASDQWFRARPLPDLATSPAAVWHGEPSRFQGQRQRVRAKLASLRGIAALVASGLTVGAALTTVELALRRYRRQPTALGVLPDGEHHHPGHGAPAHQSPVFRESTRHAVKLGTLWMARGTGLFAISRWLTKRQLRILCYHGFAVSDEAAFRPGLFIHGATFLERVAWLRKKKVRVVGLADALKAMDAGELKQPTAVITIDDGFAPTYEVLKKWSSEPDFAATVYVTSYYAEKQNPIFRLVIPYMLWASRRRVADLRKLGMGFGEPLHLHDRRAVGEASERIINLGAKTLDAASRERVCRLLGEALDVDYDELVASRRLSLMSADELSELESFGTDIQLHTHRHRIPLNESEAFREIADNRAWLKQVVHSSLTHFCYPSGEWSSLHFPWLKAQGVQSAVTCDVGLNDARTERLALKRFLDGENIAQIEFEAEMSGFLEIGRRLLRFLRVR